MSLPALLLTNQDIERVLPMADAIAAVETALRERAAGTAHSIVRPRIPVRDSALVLTPGGYDRQGIFGLRVYAAGHPHSSQLTAVWDVATGKLLVLVLGELFGAIRTGAIGGVAFKVLAPEHVGKVGVVGGGIQTRTQLLALNRVRRPERVELYRRDPEKRRQIASALAAELGIPVEPASSAEAAVRDADVVITATSASTPVVDAAWVRPGAHVSSLGPKNVGRTELDFALAARADLLVSDVPEQYHSEPECILQGTPHITRIQDLAALFVKPPTRDPSMTTLLLSHGLAGTEVAVAAVALANARKMGIGAPLPE